MAVRLKEKIEEATKLKLWVQAVVVIWGDFRAEPVEQDNVVYLRGKDLVPWLGSRPKRLSPRSQNLVTLAVQAELVPHRRSSNAMSLRASQPTLSLSRVAPALSSIFCWLEPFAELLDSPIDRVEIRELAEEQEPAACVLFFDRGAEISVGTEGIASREAEAVRCPVIDGKIPPPELVDFWDQRVVLGASNEGCDPLVPE